MDKKTSSAADFSQGFSCAQAVLRAFAADYGLDADLATRLAGAYGGGIARTGQMCGAVTGALMAIGLHYASPDPTDLDAKEGTYTVARRFLQQFEDRFGALDCPGLLGVHVGTPDGMQKARAEGVFKTRCPAYVEGAVKLVEEINQA